jgi:23S rRNA (guanosine2251-2'-O)-methyltransferase
MTTPRKTASRERGGGTGVEHLWGIHSVLEALRAGRRSLHRVRVRGDAGGDSLESILKAAAAAGVPVERVEAETLRRLTDPGGNAQGVVLDAGPLPELGLSRLCTSLAAPRRLLALDGVEDPQNLGAIIRVAEAAGVQGLVLTRRRSPPLTPAVARASAGALEWLPVARVANLHRSIKVLKKEGFWVLGADPAAAVSVFELEDRAFAGDLLVILGGEGRGVRPSIGREIDHLVKIPMAGRVASLNVATAGAVLLFEVERRVPAKRAG